MTAIAGIVIEGLGGRKGLEDFSPTREVCDVDESMCNL